VTIGHLEDKLELHSECGCKNCSVSSIVTMNKIGVDCDSSSGTVDLPDKGRYSIP
jgi:hypothetical protein